MASEQRNVKEAGSRAARRASRSAGRASRSARRKAARAPGRPPRFLPTQRWARALIYLGIALGYMAIMWFWVFPWIDGTFINRPAL